MPAWLQYDSFKVAALFLLTGWDSALPQVPKFLNPAGAVSFFVPMSPIDHPQPPPIEVHKCQVTMLPAGVCWDFLCLHCVMLAVRAHTTSGHPGAGLAPPGRWPAQRSSDP